MSKGPSESVLDPMVIYEVMRLRMRRAYRLFGSALWEACRQLAASTGGAATFTRGTVASLEELERSRGPLSGVVVAAGAAMGTIPETSASSSQCLLDVSGPIMHTSSVGCCNRHAQPLLTSLRDIEQRRAYPVIDSLRLHPDNLSDFLITAHHTCSPTALESWHDRQPVRHGARPGLHH